MNINGSNTTLIAKDVNYASFDSVHLFKLFMFRERR